MDAVTKHWTSEDTDAFVYRIASDFVLQLEKKMDGSLNQNDLARRLKVSKGRVSQVLNNPGNLTLKKIVQYSRALKMKVAVVAYDDGDSENRNGPINSEIFYECWQKSGRPNDFFSLANSTCLHREYVSTSFPNQGTATVLFTFGISGPSQSTNTRSNSGTSTTSNSASGWSHDASHGLSLTAGNFQLAGGEN
jgi:transcriptional regulator with XRE-family HTH domain